IAAVGRRNDRRIVDDALGGGASRGENRERRGADDHAANERRARLGPMHRISSLAEQPAPVMRRFPEHFNRNATARAHANALVIERRKHDREILPRNAGGVMVWAWTRRRRPRRTKRTSATAAPPIFFSRCFSS